MRAFATILILSSIALAGCIDDADPKAEIPSDWARLAVPDESQYDHDHYDPAHHQGLSTSNFELVGYDPLLSEYMGQTAAGALCGDAAQQGDRVIGVVHAFSDPVLFTVLDVTDPADPQVLAEVIAPNAPGRDVALTDDGRYVAVGVGPSTDPQVPAAALTGSKDLAAGMKVRNACGQETLIAEPDYSPGHPGVWLFDLQDPTMPTMVGQFPVLGIGTHSITAGELDGTQVVVAGVVNLVAGVSNFYFFEVGDSPTGPLQFMSLYQEPATEGNAPLINGHNDAWVQVHPGTGQHLAYLANWNQGMTILDISNLRLPTAIGRWHDNPAPNADIQSDGTGSVHEAFPMPHLLGDRHYTVIGQEILNKPSATPSGWIRFLDTTDPTNPTVVAEWALPVDVVWSEDLVFSTHYVDVWEDTLFVAHYHAGVWAVDLSGLPDEAHPPAVGVFVPANDSPAPPREDAPYDWAPTIMEMNVLPSGDVLIWDSHSGAYIVRYDASNPAPPSVWSEFQG